MTVVYNGLFAVIEPCSTAGCVLLTTVVMQEEKNMDSARTEVSVCTQGQHLFIHWGLFSVQGLDTPVSVQIPAQHQAAKLREKLVEKVER